MAKKDKPVLPKLEIPEIKEKGKLERKETETIQIEKEPKGKGKVKKNKQ
jgi:hypothetical protein